MTRGSPRRGSRTGRHSPRPRAERRGSRPRRYLRPRGEGTKQETTAVELFFDLVFVFAITRLSQLVLDDLTIHGLVRAGFLLVVLWWAWINTTWLANWLEPGSTRVRLLLMGGALSSLLAAVAIPQAFASHGLLFAATYAGFQVGRNVAATLLSPPGHHLRLTFARLLFWSVLTGALWIAGGAADPDLRLAIWGGALALDLLAPAVGYPTPLPRTLPNRRLRRRRPPLRRALPGVCDHRARGVDRGCGRHRLAARALHDDRRRADRRIRRGRSDVVAVLRHRRRQIAACPRNERAGRPACPRRLHLHPHPDHRRDHRRRGGRQPPARRSIWAASAGWVRPRSSEGRPCSCSARSCSASE